MRVIPLYFVFAFLCNCILNENLNLTEILIFICICFYIAVQQSWVWDEWWGSLPSILYFYSYVFVFFLKFLFVFVSISPLGKSWVWDDWWGSFPHFLSSLPTTSLQSCPRFISPEKKDFLFLCNFDFNFQIRCNLLLYFSTDSTSLWSFTESINAGEHIASFDCKLIISNKTLRLKLTPSW